MSGSPASRPAKQEADGAGPRSIDPVRKLGRYVRVVNPVWNGCGFIKLKKALFYVKLKRGSFVDAECSQLRLDMTHPANRAAAQSASVGYQLVKAGFEWRPGISGGATVLMAQKNSRRL